MHLVHDPNAPRSEEIGFGDFLKVDIRAGTVRSASVFQEARNPSYILTIDFGAAIGVRKSAAQITERYSPDDLVGKRVLAVVNFPPRQIGPVRSEVLVLGLADPKGAIALVMPADDVPDGARLA